MKLSYSVTLAALIAALPSTLADPNPVKENPISCGWSRASITLIQHQEPKRRKTKHVTATCPNNQVTYNERKKHYCCPGKVLGEGGNGGPYCCVGAAEVNASATSSLSCSTTIPLSEKSYSSLAHAAATSLTGSSTSKAGAAAMITSGPLAGALMAAGGLVLAL